MKRVNVRNPQRRAALRLLTVLAALPLILPSCRSTGVPADGTGAGAVRLTGISYLSGVSAGGLVENSQTAGIEGTGSLDSITGATSPAFTSGIHTEWAWGPHHVESGLDYIGFSQTLDYQLPSFGVDGSRTFRFHQVRIPITYNLHLLKNQDSNPGLIIKAGLSGGYTFHESIKDSGNLEEYQFARWDFGPTLGMALYPFPSWKAYRLGFYLDFFRGSRIFNDTFHQAEGMGGQSFMKMGVTLSTPREGLNYTRGASHE